MDEIVKKLDSALRKGANRGTLKKNEAKEVRLSVDGREEGSDYRGRQDAGRADNQRLREAADKGNEIAGVLRRGDLGVHDGALIPEATRRIMSEKGIPDLGLRETHDRSAFSNALEAAKAENPNGGMVDAQSAEGLERHYLSKGVPQETLDKMYTVGIVKDKA